MESFEFLPLLLFVAAIVVVNLLRQRAERIGKERAERQRAAAEAWGAQQGVALPAELLEEVPRTPEGEAAQAPWGRAPDRPGQPEHAQRPERPSRPERPVRAERPARAERPVRAERPAVAEASPLSSYERSLERLAERTADRAARAAAVVDNPMHSLAPGAATPLGKRLLQTPGDLRRAIVVMTVLGPCRANAPYGEGDAGGSAR